ncbi:MAG: hypothetical protein ACKO2G_16215 [Verrucomicrobiales bacterium]
MRRTFILLAAMAMTIGPSCKHGKDKPEGPGGTGTGTTETLPAEVVTETVVGRILVLGADNAFVVFQLEAGESVATGEELEVRFAGTSVGKVKVTPERKSRMVAADVLSGTMEKGYEVVRLKTEKTAPPTP